MGLGGKDNRIVAADVLDVLDHLLEALCMACGTLDASDAAPLMSLSDVVSDRLKACRTDLRKPDPLSLRSSRPTTRSQTLQGL